MIKPAFRRGFVRSTLVLTAMSLVLQPVLVAARPLPAAAPTPTQALTASGDLYLTNISEAALLGAELVLAQEAIGATPLTELSEETVVDARAKAFALAENSAVALGAVDDMADAIEALGPGLPEAVDVRGRASAAISQEMARDLGDIAGLSEGQVADLAAGVDGISQARFAVADDGLPDALRDQLLAAGFTTQEIERVTQAVGARGLANRDLATSLAQFRATQDELAALRTRALVLYVQLLGRQIGARQAHGIVSRPVTQDELKELANDELRLLIHVAHLDELWGEDPSLEVGEGDWWFIERYAGRAAQRLEALTLDTQNRALVVDLLLILQMGTLSLSARSGDADYVKGELDRLAELLETQVGESGFVEAQRGRTVGLAKILARAASTTALRERVTWPVEEASLGMTVDTAGDRLGRHGVENLTNAFGVIPESNEDNNELGLLFAAGLPFFGKLSADILLAALDLIALINDGTMLAWIEAILTGQADNPVLMGASVLFSLIPVLGVVPDIYSLVADPSVFVKALSIFGIIGSLGDLIGLIPGLQGVGGVSFLGDAASAVVKTLFKNADEAFRLVLDALRLEDAFDVVLDLVKTVIHFVGETLGSSVDEVIDLLEELFQGGLRLWDDFVSYVRRVGTRLLLELGFDEGGLLVGRVLRRGGSLTDDALRVVKRLGVTLSDEATDGLILVTRSNADGSWLRGLLNGIASGCLGAFTDSGGPKLAKIMPAQVCDVGLLEQVLKNAKKWDEAAEAGFGRLARNLDAEELGGLLRAYRTTPDALQGGLAALSKTSFEKWTTPTIDRTFAFVRDHAADMNIEVFLGKVSTHIDESIFDEQFFRMVGRLDEEPGLRRFFNPSNYSAAPESFDAISGGTAQLLRRAEAPRMPVYARNGYNFELSRAEHYFDGGSGRLRAVEFREVIGEEQFSYDLLLDNVDFGDVVETKYWRASTLQAKISDLEDQIRKYTASGRFVTVEFARRTDGGISDALLEGVVAALNETDLKGLFEMVLVP